MTRNNMTLNLHRAEVGLRGFLASLFILSSVLKAVNINSFALETRLYMDSYFWGLKSFMSSLGMSFRIDLVAAIGVCAVEVLVALLSFRKMYRKVASTGFFLTLTFFVYLTGVNLFFPTMMGSVESCGCFGELIHFSPTSSFIKSAALWMLSLVHWVLVLKDDVSWNVCELFSDKYLYICLATSVALPLYSLCAFELLEQKVYVAGFLAMVAVLAGSMMAFRVMPKAASSVGEENVQTRHYFNLEQSNERR